MLCFLPHLSREKDYPCELLWQWKENHNRTKKNGRNRRVELDKQRCYSFFAVLHKVVTDK